ncbi:MAG: 4-oxalocrotonate tautomerase [Candidatus Coatesbacteria bacterium]|nr:MAG: 4-oxalocrotonate tautomerase [Candidatus Coatesbacteria bacterium]
MPTIIVEGPEISVDKKRELARKLTDIAVEIYGIKHIVVLIKENDPTNVAVDGELIADKKKM